MLIRLGIRNEGKFHANPVLVSIIGKNMSENSFLPCLNENLKAVRRFEIEVANVFRYAESANAFVAVNPRRR